MKAFEVIPAYGCECYQTFLSWGCARRHVITEPVMMSVYSAVIVQHLSESSPWDCCSSSHGEVCLLQK